MFKNHDSDLRNSKLVYSHLSRNENLCTMIEVICKMELSYHSRRDLDSTRIHHCHMLNLLMTTRLSIFWENKLFSMTYSLKCRKLSIILVRIKKLLALNTSRTSCLMTIFFTHQEHPTRLTLSLCSKTSAKAIFRGIFFHILKRSKL